MVTSKYNDLGGVRGHILRMNDMATQLKAMDMEISEGFLIHFIMTSLPSQFGSFKINYNTQKEKWKMSELISICDQEEEIVKAETPNSAHFTTQRQGKKRKLHGKDKRHVKKNNDGNKAKTLGSKTRKCNFCREPTHFQKDCPKFKEWLAKKGLAYLDVSYILLHTTAYDNPKKYTQESISPHRAKEVKIESSIMSALNAEFLYTFETKLHFRNISKHSVLRNQLQLCFISSCKPYLNSNSKEAALQFRNDFRL
ncbi:hypothetical protein ZIOFF_015488 [Zingiber officinale]|uniref:Polyprotein n=1 Tax=Zingiber officinale TaxID=94328 RepID=A0A8J5LWE4_ZINOF|nr:hypothetical protein ZIOFF_015488 [Zingiber officinale]